MPADDDAVPSAHLGDYPHGVYWSTQAPTGAQDDDALDYCVDGSVIRMMWDYSVQIPLWDAGGLLPEDPKWLREALGLGEQLIDDLRRWGSDMNEVDTAPRRRAKEAYRALDERGQQLTRRLQQQAGPQFTVRYHPW